MHALPDPRTKFRSSSGFYKFIMQDLDYKYFAKLPQHLFKKLLIVFPYVVFCHLILLHGVHAVRS